MDDAPPSAALDQNSTHASDAHWMRCALALAEQGVGLSSPNPTVGCVLVKDDRIVGRGFHQYEHRDHAEIVALKHAGADARGSTAYVTLEPCSHFGRTPPCATTLIEGGIRTVVVATADPNPAVHGRGIDMLRAAGIEVRVGTLQAEARALNNAFARFIRTRQPFVTLKIAATLDGRIAPDAASHPHGRSFAITGAAARAEVQSLRHSHDALLTGVGTVLADDPLLTDRSQRPRRRPLQRIVLDSHLRIPLTSRLLSTVSDDLLVVTRGGGEPEKRRALLDRGVRLLDIEAQAEGGISLRALLHKLGEGNITSVMIEAGARLNRSALLTDAVDGLALFYAPFFLGGAAVPMLAADHVVAEHEDAPSRSARWPRMQATSVRPIGDDFLVEGLLRDPWA